MEQASLQDLTRCRERIDAIDVRLVELLNERTVVVEQIGRIKEHLALAIYEPKREEQVFENIRRNNKGPLAIEALKRIFERIIDEMRDIQRLEMIQREQNKTE